MPVLAPKRFVIRGRIRAQMQYAQLILGRIIKAGDLNTQLGIFAPAGSPGDAEEFGDVQAQIIAALKVRR